MALGWGIAEALLFGLFARYSYGSDYRDEIRTGIALTWSWLGANKGALIGLLVGAITEVERGAPRHSLGPTSVDLRLVGY